MNILKKQGVAWVIAAVMILAAIGIGRAKGVATPAPGPAPIVSSAPIQNQNEGYYVYDDANVLTNSEVTKLSDLNHKLMQDMEVVIACVTTNYGGGDLYQYALDCAARLNLAEYDFIVVLDISGQNYWLVQGSGLVDLFSDDDCASYAQYYMENDFARRHYGSALLSLADALADWYYDHY